MSHEGEIMSEIEKEIIRVIEDFQILNDWDKDERDIYLVSIGNKLPSFDSALKIKENLLSGCVSEVHFKADFRDGLMYYQATSNAAIVRGLIALMLRVYSGRKPDEILAHPPDFFAKIGLGEHLSVNRQSSVESVMTAIRKNAQAHIRSN